MKPTAEIKMNPGDGSLFMIVNGDTATAWAIEENEVEAIMKACKKYIDINKSKK
jgi:hypothetical protein